MSAVDVYTAIADPTRRGLLDLLAEGERPVKRLAEPFAMTRPAVSQHLRVLKEAGLVSERKDGTRRLYRIEPDAVEALRAYFDAFWSQALAAFKAAAESEERSSR